MESTTARDEAFIRLVAARWTALLRTAALLTGSRTAGEDLLQTALTKSYVAWPRIREPEALEGYVRRTMVTTYTSWWRRHLGRESVVAALPDRPDRDAMALADTRGELGPALGALPRGQRAVVVLRFFEDLTEAETARVLGCSVGTVKSQTHRALSALRASLTDPPPGGPAASAESSRPTSGKE